MITLDFKSVKASFFDKPLVMKAVDKARREALNEAGRQVRKVAQKSLVYGKDISQPGRPPTAHKSGMRTRVSKKTGKSRTRAVSYLREFLLYSYDSQNRSVVIGPVRLNSTVDYHSMRALESGGRSTALDHGRRKSINVKARPFMSVALEIVRPSLPQMWQDTVR